MRRRQHEDDFSVPRPDGAKLRPSSISSRCPLSYGKNFVLLFSVRRFRKAELTIIWTVEMVEASYERQARPRDVAMPRAERYDLEVTDFDEKPAGSGDENLTVHGTFHRYRSCSQAA